jgi:dTDP-4-amino-4,6-dideoxy-D-galactose acyltransferase
MVSCLHWDSDFFNLRIGNTNSEIKDPKSVMKNFDLVYCFTDQKSILTQKHFEEIGANLVDQKVTLKLNLNNISEEKLLPFIRSINSSHYSSIIQDLAIQSGEYSRFKLDERFNKNDFEKLYTEWIVNSLNRTIALDVFEYFEDDKTLGIITLESKEKGLHIGLLAVDSKYRGQKIGKRLITHAIQIGKKRQFSSIIVETQLQNTLALNFYQKIGFEQLSTTNIYHLWTSK